MAYDTDGNVDSRNDEVSERSRMEMLFMLVTAGVK